MTPPKLRLSKVCAQCRKSFEVFQSRENARFCNLICMKSWRSNFMRHVDRSGGDSACWPWTSADDGQGKYGRACIGGKLKGAHVAVYEKLVGPIPAGLEIDHLCRNPICCNPSHLEPVTRRENVLRQPKVIAARAATHCCHGHRWTDENTYIHPSQGSRVCRKCTVNSVQKYEARNPNRARNNR